MNNFTKSIVYSGVVLAAGLVAIFAIYNNVSSDPSGVSYIEPAAGFDDSQSMSDMGGTMLKSTESAIEAAENMAAEAAGDINKAASEIATDATESVDMGEAADANEAATNTQDAIDAIASDATEAASKATESVQDTAKDAIEATGESVENTEPAAGEVSQNATDAVKDIIK